jgi:hypothetical protein
MSIINWFSKPQWKNKDASIRAQAVHSDQSPELKLQLENISQNDESEKVRSAALRRLQNYTLIAKIGENDPHKSVKSVAYKILQDWFSKTDSAQQIPIISSINDSKTIEIVAAHAKNKAIRSHCIEKINKQGLLAELLINEQEKDLRLIIVEKINKPATLKRLIKQIKNKDKTIFKIIQAKLENDGDMLEIITKKALDICEQMEKLIHNPQSSSKADVIKIHNKWQELSTGNDLKAYNQRFEGAYRTASLTFDPEQRNEFLDQQRKQRINTKINELQQSLTDNNQTTWEELQTQISKYSGFDLSHASAPQKNDFEKNLNALKALRDAQSKQQDLPEKLLAVVDKLDATLKHKYNQPKQISQFRKMWDSQSKNASSNSAYSTLKSRFEKAMAKLTDKIELSATMRDEAAKKAVDDISKVKLLIKNGKLAEAKVAINSIAENKKIAGFHPLIKQHKFDFDAVWNELKELRQWQTWSNDKIRMRLIDELKQLLGTGTHPDALLKKMKQANSQWKNMEEHEKLEGDRYGVRNMELYGEFRAVQKALFEPAQQFFEKRSEIWGKELQQLEADIQELHDVDLNATPDRELARMVRAAVKQLRNLDKIPPKSRGKCAAAIRAGTARVDAHLQESYAIAERRKQKLIDQAQELVELEDLDAAIEQAKALQQEWKDAGIVQQAQERKLWKAFRKANDAVFNRIKLQRDQVKAENRGLMDQANQLINDCQNAIKSETSAQKIHSIIEKFKDDFNAFRVENRGIINKANKLIDSSENKVQSLANTETIDALKNAQKFANICLDVELGKLDNEKAEQKWQKLTPLSDRKLSNKLKSRLAQAGTANKDYVKTASTILIAAEYLTGQATPDEHKELRLAYQVDELSKRMSGEEILSVTDKASQLLSDWFTLAGAEAAFIKANDKRIKKVMKELFEQLQG